MRRVIPALTVLILAMAALGLVLSCASRGGPPASRPAPEPSGESVGTPPPPPAPGSTPQPSFASVTVVAPSAAPAVYAHHFGVRPTVDTRARPAVMLSPDVDTASFHVAQAELRAGRLPPEAAVRLEEFVAATHTAGPTSSPRTDFELTADWRATPLRPGYQLLRLLIRAPTRAAHREVQVARTADELREAWAAGQDVVFLAAGAVSTDLAKRPAASGGRTSVVGLIGARGDDRGAYDDEALEAMARNLGGEYHARTDLGAAEYAARRLADAGGAAARGVTLRVEFDPAVVRRYRLLGWEGRGLREGHAPPPGALAAGSEVVLLFEVRAEDGAPRLGDLTVGWQPPTGGRRIDRLAIQPAPAQEGGWGTALVAAAVAEKLRGSYWSRHVTWARLRALVADHAAGRSELAAMIDAAAAVDRRPDRFARDLPVAKMGFDALPVVR